MPRRPRPIFALLTLVVLATGSAASAEPGTGHFSIQFTERSPHSDLAKLKIRMHWQNVSQPMPDYDLTDETFSVYAPKDYNPDESYGLFIFISPSDSGKCWGQWHEVLREHKLIWIGAEKAGNMSQIWRRMGLALDAAHNMPKRYNIDENRIYISGFSGGGRTSSRMGVVFADVFDGAFPMAGCDYFKTVTLPSHPETPWRGRYIAPKRDVLNRAKRFNRYVLLTGETDYNREQTFEIFKQGFLRDNFFHADYIELPGQGHSPPDNDWFEKGIELLDAPLKAGAIGDGKAHIAYRRQRADEDLAAATQLKETNLFAGYRALEIVALKYTGTPAGLKAKSLVRALRADPETRKIIDETLAEQQAAQLLRNGRNYIQHQFMLSAKRELDALIKRYPETPQAKEARQLVETIPENPQDPAYMRNR